MRPTCATSLGALACGVAALLSASAASRADDPAETAVAAPPAAAADAQAEADPLFDKLWEIVQTAPKDGSREDLALRLGGLGVPGLPALFRAYRQVDGSFRTPVDRHVLLAAFRHVPAADVLAFVREKTAADPSLDVLIAGLQIVGEVGGAGSTGLALDLASRLTPIGLKSPVLGGVVRSALATAVGRDPAGSPGGAARRAEPPAAGTAATVEQVVELAAPAAPRPPLARDRGGWETLRQAWPGLGPALREIVLAAVDETRSRDGLVLYGSLLGSDAETNGALLRHMCRMPRLAALDATALGSVRSLVRDNDAEVRRCAVLDLGVFQDAASFDAVLDALADTDGAVVEAAVWSLRRLTGAAFGAERSEWIEWRRADMLWSKHDRVRETEILGSPDPNLVVVTLQSLGRRRLFGDALVHDLTPCLRHEAAAVRRAACDALAALGSAGALDALVAATLDPDADVRAAAGAALSVLTDLAGPADAKFWRAALQRGE